MNENKPGMFMPALIGGMAAGVLSGIPIVHCMCCLWIIGGALLSAHLLAKDSALSLTAGDGAIVGALAGIFAAVIQRLVSLPFAAVSLAFAKKLMESISQLADEMPQGWDTWFNRSREITPAYFFLGLMITAFIFAALGALGGILGASLFGKKKTPSAVQGAPHAPENPGDRQS